MPEKRIALTQKQAEIILAILNAVNFNDFIELTKEDRAEAYRIHTMLSDSCMESDQE